jgi:hypothetical protein
MTCNGTLRFAASAVTAAACLLGFAAGASAQRSNPAARFTAVGTGGADFGGLRVFDAATGSQLFSSGRPFGGLFEVRVAVGDLNGDGTPDLVTAPGPGGAPLVVAYDGALLRTGVGAALTAFLAYEPGFTGGVFVAAGDTDGDGRAEIITGPDAGGAPLVKTFRSADGQLLSAFLAYEAGFTGGVRVAAGDVTGDGAADVVTAPGAGGGPLVKAFRAGDGRLLTAFLAYEATFTGGVFIAAGDVDGDGAAEIITGPGAGGGPLVKVFGSVASGQPGRLLSAFLAYEPTFSGGVRVAAGPDAASLNDIVTGPGPGGTALVKIIGRVAGALPGEIGQTLKNAFIAIPPEFLDLLTFPPIRRAIQGAGGVFVAQ